MSLNHFVYFSAAIDKVQNARREAEARLEAEQRKAEEERAQKVKEEVCV